MWEMAIIAKENHESSILHFIQFSVTRLTIYRILNGIFKDILGFLQTILKWFE